MNTSRVRNVLRRNVQFGSYRIRTVPQRHLPVILLLPKRVNPISRYSSVVTVILSEALRNGEPISDNNRLTPVQTPYEVVRSYRTMGRNFVSTVNSYVVLNSCKIGFILANSLIQNTISDVISRSCLFMLVCVIKLRFNLI